MYINGTTLVVGVTLPDGSRKFVRWDREIYSTNVAAFTGSLIICKRDRRPRCQIVE